MMSLLYLDRGVDGLMALRGPNLTTYANRIVRLILASVCFQQPGTPEPPGTPPQPPPAPTAPPPYEDPARPIPDTLAGSAAVIDAPQPARERVGNYGHRLSPLTTISTYRQREQISRSGD
jgi:hypothetical protein